MVPVSLAISATRTRPVWHARPDGAVSLPRWAATGPGLQSREASTAKVPRRSEPDSVPVVSRRTRGSEEPCVHESAEALRTHMPA